MFKSIVGPILALLGALAVLISSHLFVYEKGKFNGVDSFHKACYNSSSALLIKDEETKDVVICAPHRLDKQPTM